MYRAGQGPVHGQGLVLANVTGPTTKAVAHVLIYALILQRQQGHKFPFVNLRIDIAKDKVMPCQVQGRAFLGPGRCSNNTIPTKLVKIRKQMDS
jgi:hypothetical protein